MVSIDTFKPLRDVDVNKPPLIYIYSINVCHRRLLEKYLPKCLWLVTSWISSVSMHLVGVILRVTYKRE